MSGALALVGDWNATPADRGPGTPRQLAAATGLQLFSAGPGRHGDIDYLLADCPVVFVRRHDPPTGSSRSDHDVVTCQLVNPDDPSDRLRLTSWNVQYGRPRDLVGHQLAQLLEHTRPDVLCLQEAADYHAQIRHVAGRLGYMVLAYSGPGRHHNVVVVRGQLRPRRPSSVQLSPRGWRLADSTGQHAPLYATSWRVRWLRVIDVHMPPSVNWRHSVPYGPPMRVAAYLAGMAKLRSWVRTNKRHRRP